MIANKASLITIAVSVLAAVIFFMLWQVSQDNLKNTEERLCDANNTIQTLKNDNDKLLVYIQTKDQEIKKIEKEYMNKLNNIPKDACGDIKPSKELLDYLKQNVQ